MEFTQMFKDKSTGCKKLILEIKVLNSVLSTVYLFVEVPQSWSTRLRNSVWLNSSNSRENKMSTTHPEAVTNMNLCVSAYVANNKPLYKVVQRRQRYKFLPQFESLTCSYILPRLQRLLKSNQGYRKLSFYLSVYCLVYVLAKHIFLIFDTTSSKPPLFSCEFTLVEFRRGYMIE